MIKTKKKTIKRLKLNPDIKTQNHVLAKKRQQQEQQKENEKRSRINDKKITLMFVGHVLEFGLLFTTSDYTRPESVPAHMV